MTVEGIKLRLKGNGLHGKNTKVWINGDEVTRSVQSVSVRWDCGGINVATVQFIVDDLDIDSSVLVKKDAPRTIEEIAEDVQAFIARMHRRNG